MIPDPWSVVSGGTGAIAGWSWDQVAAGITRWVLEALTAPIDGALNFLKTSARPDLTAPWFADAGSPFAAVRNLGAVLLVVFLLAGIIHGLIVGDVAGMLRRVAFDAPLAVLGMVGVTVVVDLLLDLTDAMSTAVLGGSDGDALKFLTTFGVQAHSATGGFSTVVIGVVALVAAFVIWIELMVRSSLLYLLVALSPLVFAASVWPAAKGVLRRLFELMLAVILSKLVISVALAVGVAALGGMTGTDEQGQGVGEFAAQGLGKLVVGTAILCMTAFSPFMVLRLIPVAEAAVVAQGMSRAPVSTARSAMNTAYYGRSLGRLGGGGGGGGGEGDALPLPDAEAPPFGPATGPATSDATGGAAGASSGESTGTAASTSGGAAGAGGAAGTASAGGATGAGVAGGAAVAGPAVVVVGAVEVARAGKEIAESTAEQAGTLGGGSEAGRPPGSAVPPKPSGSPGDNTAGAEPEPPERPGAPESSTRVSGGEP
jgi:hypothetical protein